MPTFDEFARSLSRLGGVATVDEEGRRRAAETAAAIQALPEVSRAALTELIQERGEFVPFLALCIGLSQEALKNILRHGLGSPSWLKLSASRPAELVALLDDQFELATRLEAERFKDWSFGDVLVERYASRSRATSSIGRGRGVEDQVEAIVSSLGLPYEMRTRFTGSHGRDGPCDLAVPSGGDEALIVCGMKGFDSTGSKLTDAVTEIERMADVRLARQFVFVVVDGIGWLGRKSDLKRIYQLLLDQAIDGLYTLSQLAQLKADIKQAARLRGLLPQTS